MSDIQPTEADREKALPWRDAKDMVWKLRECKEYDYQASMLQSLAVNLRADAVKAEWENSSRREQEARDDERKRWTAILDRAMEFVRIYAKDNPKWTPVGMSEQDPHGVHALVAEISALLQGTEPAKFSEDVEMDIELINEVLSEYGNKSIKEIRSAISAFDRLVARLKEGNRG